MPYIFIDFEWERELINADRCVAFWVNFWIHKRGSPLIWRWFLLPGFSRDHQDGLLAVRIYQGAPEKLGCAVESPISCVRAKLLKSSATVVFQLVYAELRL
ncbi:hypothetical protein AKJ16_DCAP05273 [Drosera capensis]